MTNLAGHDIESVLEAFHAASDDDVPTCFIAYTIKGFGLPFAGHKDNHAGLLNPAQMAQLKDEMRIADARSGTASKVSTCRPPSSSASSPRCRSRRCFPRGLSAPVIPVPAALPLPTGERMSTQEGFGRILFELAGTREPLADRIVTLSPDVTVSTKSRRLGQPAAACSIAPSVRMYSGKKKSSRPTTGSSAKRASTSSSASRSTISSS